MMAIRVVANPSSGKGRAGRQLPLVLETLDGLGLAYDVVTTRDAAHLRESVRAARETGHDRVIICGGDGSIHLAVQELAGSETALGIVPAGTGDDNARLLGLPRKDVEAATRQAALGPISRVDLGHVVTADGTSRYFLGVMSSGFDSMVNERANAMTWPSGDARYLVAIVGELRTFRPVHYSADIDGRPVSGEAMLVAVGNGSSYGGGMRVCPDADPADGLLEVTWLHGVRKSTFLRVFPQVFSGGHVHSRHVSTTRARHLRLDAPGQIVYADGEHVGPLPAVIDVRPQALRVARLGGTA